MRCFCIIRYTDSLPAWRTGIRPERSAGCNEKSPSVARGSTYFRVRPASLPPPFLSLSLSLTFPSPPCSSSPSGLNLRVSETGRAVPKARVPLLHLSVRLPLVAYPLLLFVFLCLSPFLSLSLFLSYARAFRCLSPFLFPRTDRGGFCFRDSFEFRVHANVPPSCRGFCEGFGDGLFSR